jgi:hypothetical protein
MALIETVFRRSKDERGKLNFDTISKDTRVPSEDVEHLIMKALSLGLLKGSIDEVDKVISVSTFLILRSSSIKCSPFPVFVKLLTIMLYDVDYMGPTKSFEYGANLIIEG